MYSLLKSKTAQLVIVLFLSASIIVTGTYAWTDFFNKTNTGTLGIVPEDVTLFDFSNQLGEVYVVNNARQEFLVRIKLVQNLQIGGTQAVPGTLADDSSTWLPDHEAIRKFFRPVYSKAVISMKEWKQLGTPIGDYWVADINGWYYYAKRLSTGEATRTLITEIATNQFNVLVDGKYQTAVFLQSVQKNELTNLLSVDANSFSSDGKLFMRYVSGEMVEFVH